MFSSAMNQWERMVFPFFCQWYFSISYLDYDQNNVLYLGANCDSESLMEELTPHRSWTVGQYLVIIRVVFNFLSDCYRIKTLYLSCY